LSVASHVSVGLKENKHRGRGGGKENDENVKVYSLLLFPPSVHYKLEGKWSKDFLAFV